MGMDVLVKLVNKSRFPWVLSNVFAAENHETLFNYETRVIVDINGVKVYLDAKKSSKRFGLNNTSRLLKGRIVRSS